MDYTSKIGDRLSQAHINYQCPCGCTAGLTYDRETGAEHLGRCCCGRLLWVGESANTVITESFREGVKYLVDRGSVQLPWGDELPTALAVPIDQLAFEREKKANGETLAKVTDPVCRMMIYPEDAVATVEFGGSTHYFCNERCKTRFVAEPERYSTV